MTAILGFDEWLDELQNLIETKENPNEWYVLHGRHVGDYSINAAEKPDEVPDDPTDMPEEDRPATENVKGFYQIGTFGWAAAAFADDFGFVGEAGFSDDHDKIDRRLNGLLLVHESVLSDEATRKATEARQKAKKDGGLQ